MIRFAGILFLSIIPILFGFWMAKRKREQFDIHAEMLRFIKEIRFQIAEFSRPQEEIFHLFQSKVLEDCAFLSNLRERSREFPDGAFMHALEHFSRWDAFDDMEQSTLENFSLLFGMQSKISQLEDCDRAIHLLERQEEKKKLTIQQEIKTAKVVGFAIGIGLAILFI